MKRKNLLLLIALLLTAVTQGAQAQASWESAYVMTNTTSANWTALTEGSTTGQTIGSAGNTTYCYASGNLSFTNSTAGGCGGLRSVKNKGFDNPDDKLGISDTPSSDWGR